MRCSEMSPNRRAFVAPNGGRVHLYLDCHYLQRSDAAGLQCGMLNPAAEVCPRCERRYERHADPRDGMAAMLADMEPEDLGLLPFGAR